MGCSEPIQFKMPPSQASIWLAVLQTCLQANRVANVLLVNAFAGIPHHCLSQSSFVSSAWQPHSDVTCKHCLASVYNLWGSFHGFMSTISSQRKHRLLWNAWHMMHHDTWKLLMENLTLILEEANPIQFPGAQYTQYQPPQPSITAGKPIQLQPC